MDGKLFQVGLQDTPTVTHSGEAQDTNEMAINLAKALVSILKANRPKNERNEMDDEEC
jgi:hypothetical protein